MITEDYDPTSEQQDVLNQYLGACRFVNNYFINNPQSTDYPVTPWMSSLSIDPLTYIWELARLHHKSGRSHIMHKGVHTPELFFVFPDPRLGINKVNVTIVYNGTKYILEYEEQDEPIVVDLDNFEVTGPVNLSFTPYIDKAKKRLSRSKYKLETKTNGSNNHQKSLQEVNKMTARLDNLKSEYINQAVSEIAKAKPSQIIVNAKTTQQVDDFASRLVKKSPRVQDIISTVGNTGI